MRQQRHRALHDHILCCPLCCPFCCTFPPTTVVTPLMQEQIAVLSLLTYITTSSVLSNVNCIVFIHFYSASHSMILSEALPTTAIDTVLEFTRRSPTGNCT